MISSKPVAFFCCVLLCLLQAFFYISLDFFPLFFWDTFTCHTNEIVSLVADAFRQRFANGFLLVSYFILFHFILFHFILFTFFLLLANWRRLGLHLKCCCCVLALAVKPEIFVISLGNFIFASFHFRGYFCRPLLAMSLLWVFHEAFSWDLILGEWTPEKRRRIGRSSFFRVLVGGDYRVWQRIFRRLSRNLG